MLEVMLRYEGAGRFSPLAGQDTEALESEFSSGEVLHAKMSRPRSVRQNNFFHALCEDAFDNRRAGPFFATWRELKGWLLIEAGHCVTHRVPISRKMSDADLIVAGGAIARVLRHLNPDYATYALDRRRREFVVRVPKSMKTQGPGVLDTKEASAIIDRVAELICEHILPGTEPEELLEHARSKAA